MSKPSHLQPADLQGFARLAVEATAGVTDLVEAMHGTIINPIGRPDRTKGITGLVYRSIGGVTRLVAGGLDLVLGQLPALIAQRDSSPEREAVLAALNGSLGDYLIATSNPLAITMSARRDGKRLTLEQGALRAAIPQANGKLLVLVHGLCMNDLQWNRHGHDHGAALARELGYTPVYLHYNSGQHVSTNGEAFADLLESLVSEWPQPVEELVIVGHSMGGLVSRSACHFAAQAGHAWLAKLDKLVFLGTPHHGAPLERGGNWVDVILGATPYSAPFARLGKVRSAGITDLRYGYLLPENWEGRDRFARGKDTGATLPLPLGKAHRVKSYTLAATTGAKAGDINDKLWGDGLVPLNSALGIHAHADRSLAFPKARQWIAYETNHMELLNRPEVYERLRKWLAA
jgi:pimeloyl-ACP methyl ester carboxylesterase